jgi:hypothetical protein
MANSIQMWCHEVEESSPSRSASPSLLVPRQEPAFITNPPAAAISAQTMDMDDMLKVSELI